MAKRILVVDDEVDFVDLIKKRLEHKGYDTETAYDGKEAMEKMRSYRPDLVLLDIVMPEMNGYEVMHQIRGSEDRKLASTPIVVVSCKDSKADVFKAYSACADYFISKPFKLETLANIVNYLIGDLTQLEREELERKL